jgi:hypothetical protein
VQNRSAGASLRRLNTASYRSCRSRPGFRRGRAHLGGHRPSGRQSRGRARLRRHDKRLSGQALAPQGAALGQSECLPDHRRRSGNTARDPFNPVHRPRLPGRLHRRWARRSRCAPASGAFFGGGGRAPSVRSPNTAGLRARRSPSSRSAASIRIRSETPLWRGCIFHEPRLGACRRQSPKTRRLAGSKRPHGQAICLAQRKARSATMRAIRMAGTAPT